jgi:signal transduction histidine kinase
MQARLRLTLLYAGVFLLLGTALLVLLNGLTRSGARAVLATPNGVVVTPVVQQQNSDFNHVLEASWVVLAITTVASALLGWFLAGRVLRPVRSIATTARTISAGNLHQRLALNGPNDEFRQLGDTLDDLFARLEASFAAQRRFVANASHELRTPLTLDRTLLELALRDPDASARKLRTTCEELLASSKDQGRLLESLLTLASSERGLEQRETVDLGAVVERLLAGRDSLRIDAHLGRAVATGDPALLERLVANLLDNAFEHNLAGGSVEVRTATEGGAAVLSVANSGEMIPATEVERLFEPFQRLDTARGVDANGHHGLGLSIVRAIATAHGATVTARPRPTGGLEVTVRF